MPQRLDPNMRLSVEPEQLNTLTNGPDRFILQDDGNLVLYHSGKPVWDSKTQGKGGRHAVMQNDGNFVMDTGSPNQSIWDTKTFGHPGAYLILQDDGNVVIYAGNQPLWATNTVHPVIAHDQPAAQAAQPAATQPRTYTVQQGDSLSAIAQRFGYSNWQQLYEANRGVIGDNPNLIYPGETLTLP